MAEQPLYCTRRGRPLPAACQMGACAGYATHRGTRYLFVSPGRRRPLPRLYRRRRDCCGCSACYAACPLSGEQRPQSARRLGADGAPLRFTIALGGQAALPRVFAHTGAITLLPDEEGFLYPVVDAQLCIGCLRCEGVCPLHKACTCPQF